MAVCRQAVDQAAPGNWQAAWAFYMIGNDFMASSDRQRRQAGMLALLSVPAFYEHDQPYLAGLALDRVAEAFRTDGELMSASALDGELRQLYPGHPINRDLVRGSWIERN